MGGQHVAIHFDHEYLVMSLNLYMPIGEAAERWASLFTRKELMQAARYGSLRHIKKGRRRFVTEDALMDYLKSMEITPCQDGRSIEGLNSEGSGSRKRATALTGSAAGMTAEQERSAVNLLRQQMKRKRSSSSQGMC
jgi:hypothetical protein